MEQNALTILPAHACILTGRSYGALVARANQLIEKLQGTDPVHPDVVWLRRDKASVIPVGEVREKIVNDIIIRPYREPYKIYIIEEAQRMGPAAQNALLKTLEEPPEYGIILMLTDRPESLLDTVLSRAAVITVDGEENPVAEMESEILSGLHEIRNGKNEFRDRLAVRVAELGKEGFMPETALEIVRRWLRDLLYIREKATNMLYYPGETEYYEKDADTILPQDVFYSFDRLAEAESRLGAGANTELVLKALFAGLKL